MAEHYASFLKPLAGRQIDLAFLPVDPRQEEAGTWGMDYFLEHARSRYIFPMHCWEHYEMIRDYKAENAARYPDVQIMEITAPGQSFVLESCADSRQ